MTELTEALTDVVAKPVYRAAAILLGALLLAAVVRLLFNRLVPLLTGKTDTDLDDRVVAEVRGPIVLSILLVAVAVVLVDLGVGTTPRFVILGLIRTIVVVVWTRAALRVGRILLTELSERVDRLSWIEPRTLPLLEIALQIFVVGGAVYFTLIAWNIDPTSWVASAGIAGIAIGFAAKDTLANLFAGIFIVADAPYKIGDFVVLDDRIRGMVADIGIRSTRLLTRDDIEITVPNAVIGNARIANETGGPYDKMRVRVKVSVAYGSDVDQVREVLLSCLEGVDYLSPEPAPRVRFREFGDSGLLFELLAWITEPVFRGNVLDNLNTRVYKAFRDAGIEIPYSKHDVYVKELPRQ